MKTCRRCAASPRPLLRASRDSERRCRHCGRCGASSWTTWRRCPPATIPDALKPADLQRPARVRPRPEARGQGGRPAARRQQPADVALRSLQCGDRTATLAIANATFDSALPQRHRRRDTACSVLSKLAIAAAQLGRADAVRYLIPTQIQAQDAGARHGVQERRRAGQSHDAARRTAGARCAAPGARRGSAAPGAAAEQSARARRGSGHPRFRRRGRREWDASFQLLARGGFLVSVVDARADRWSLSKWNRRPAPSAACAIHGTIRGGEVLTGSLLTFPTRKGERIRVTPA